MHRVRKGEKREGVVGLQSVKNGRGRGGWAGLPQVERKIPLNEIKRK